MAPAIPHYLPYLPTYPFHMDGVSYLSHTSLILPATMPTLPACLHSALPHATLPMAFLQSWVQVPTTCLCLGPCRLCHLLLLPTFGTTTHAHYTLHLPTTFLPDCHHTGYGNLCHSLTGHCASYIVPTTCHHPPGPLPICHTLLQPHALPPALDTTPAHLPDTLCPPFIPHFPHSPWTLQGLDVTCCSLPTYILPLPHITVRLPTGVSHATTCRDRITHCAPLQYAGAGPLQVHVPTCYRCHTTHTGLLPGHRPFLTYRLPYDGHHDCIHSGPS